VKYNIDMCYNPTVSIGTFIFGVSVAILAFLSDKIKNKRAIIVFLSITAMQLLEYFAWTYYNNKKIIKILSVLGLLLLLLQIILLIYYFTHDKIRKFLFISLGVFIILFIFLQLPYMNFDMTVGKNKHLIWHWLDLPLIWIVFILIFYIIPLLHLNNYLSTFFSLFMLITSIFFYWKYKTWGTMWCYFLNLYWIFVLIIIIYRTYEYPQKLINISINK